MKNGSARTSARRQSRRRLCFRYARFLFFPPLHFSFFPPSVAALCAIRVQKAVPGDINPGDRARDSVLAESIGFIGHLSRDA